MIINEPSSSPPRSYPYSRRGDAVVANEQGVKERTVVVESPSLEKATAAYDSAAYAEALKALGDGLGCATFGSLKG